MHWSLSTKYSLGPETSFLDSPMSSDRNVPIICKSFQWKESFSEVLPPWPPRGLAKMPVLSLHRFITYSNQNHSCIGLSLSTSLHALSVGCKGVTQIWLHQSSGSSGVWSGVWWAGLHEKLDWVNPWGFLSPTCGTCISHTQGRRMPVICILRILLITLKVPMSM